MSNRELSAAFYAISEGLKRAKDSGLEAEFIFTLLSPYIKTEDIPQQVLEACYEWDM